MNERTRDAVSGLQPAYEPPRAMRVGGMRTGDGGMNFTCTDPGSSAEGDCGTGSSPTVGCIESGNSAGQCDSQGSGAAQVVDCRYQGSGQPD